MLKKGVRGNFAKSSRSRICPKEVEPKNAYNITERKVIRTYVIFSESNNIFTSNNK